MVSGISQNSNWNNVALASDASVKADNEKMMAKLRGKGPLASSELLLTMPDVIEKAAPAVSKKEDKNDPRLILNLPQMAKAAPTDKTFDVNVLVDNGVKHFKAAERMEILTANVTFMALSPEEQGKLIDVANNATNGQFDGVIEIVNHFNTSIRIREMTAEESKKVISAIHLMRDSELFDATLLYILTSALWLPSLFDDSEASGIIRTHDRGVLDASLLGAWLEIDSHAYNIAVKEAMEILRLPENFVENLAK